MATNKPRIIKDYDKLTDEIKEQIKFVYPEGFSNHLIRFTNKEGNRISALPFETKEKYYLVRMTIEQAIEIVEEDEDYDNKGLLKDETKEAYEEKYSDIDYLSNQLQEKNQNEDIDYQGNF